MANDARNKLRNMGGIMASFPELVQETQYFKNGGMADIPQLVAAAPLTRAMASQRGLSVSDFIQSLSPEARTQLIRNITSSPPDLSEDDRLYQVFAERQAAERNLPTQEELDLGLLHERDRQRNRDLGIADVMSGMTPPSVDDSAFSAPDIQPFVRPDQGPRLIHQDPYGQSQGKLAAMILRTMRQLAEETDPYVRQGLENRLKVLQTAQTVGNAAVDTVTDAASLTMRAVNNPLLSAAGNLAGVVNPEFGATILDLRDLAAGTANELALMGEEGDPVAALLESSIAGQTSDEAQPTLEEAPAPAEGQETEEDQDPTVEQRPASEGLVVKPELLAQVLEAVNQDPTLTPQSDPAPVPTKRDLRSQYRKNIELFKEIYGESDEDRARDKAMSLAMLGLAIASGQSPNALTNIAQGTMAGLQGMSEQEQARRERDRGLQTLALETAIAESEAETEAARQAAESALDFRRDVYLLGLNGGNTYGSTTSPISAAVRLFSEKGTEANNRLTPLGKRLSKATSEERRRVILEEVYKDLQPFYGDNMPSFADMSAAVDTTGTGGASPAPGAENEEIDNIIGIQP